MMTELENETLLNLELTLHLADTLQETSTEPGT
jgi:hypothetical protein